MKISLHFPLLANNQRRSNRLQSMLQYTSLIALRMNGINAIRHSIVCLLLVNALCVQFLFAQSVVPQLIGMAHYGGTSREGTIFRINADGTDLKAVFNFPGWPNARLPDGSVIQASNGSLYGMTTSPGTLFKIKHDGTGYTVLHNFSYFSWPTGVHPSGSLLQATNGMLYGMANGGGFLGFGTIFRINMDGTGFSVIHHFNGWNGGHPSQSSLIQGQDGSLYGMSSAAGASNRGALFKLNLDGSDYRVLHHFSNPGYPGGSIMQATNGSLYGMVNDGIFSDGAIFKVEHHGGGFEILHTLKTWEGSRPLTSLIQGPDGNLYGMAYAGGNYGRGTILKINPDGTNFTVLHHFDYINGAHPKGDLTVYNNHLYGFTAGGGEHEKGVVFKFDLATGTFSKLGDLNDETGANPQIGKLLLVYSPTTVETPTDQANTITFSNVLAKSMTVSFTPGNGSRHLAVMKIGSPPAFQPVDNTTYTGGLGSGQTVVYNGTESSFELTGLRPDKEYYIKIFSYNSDGTIARYMLANAPVANRHTTTTTEKFYGMASNGGAAYRGTIFRVDPGGTSPLSIMHNFRNNDGRHPLGQLIEAKDGLLYGMNSGGILNLTNDPVDSRHGTIFRISPDGTRYTILRRLTIPDGSSPRGSLIQASNSVLYGMAQRGGTAGYGTCR